MSELCLPISSTNPHFSTLISDFLIISFPQLLKFILCFNSASPQLFESKVSVLLSAYYSVVQRLRLHSDNESEDLWYLVDFKALKMVFLGHPFEFLDYRTAEGSESPVLESSCYDNGSITAICNHNLCLRDRLGENSAEMGSITRGTMEKKMLEDFLKELDVFENMTWSDTVEEKKKEAKGKKIHKAKDWKRTLGCKFYEERQNASDSSEGMDLLWEKYEMDSIKENSNKKKKMKEKGGLKSYLKEEQINEHIEQLCCLQAPNLSAGKMNFGMATANLVRISKAIKGFKWLHHLSKNNKKVHCGDRF